MSYVILATPCAYFLQLPVDTYAPLVLAGAGHRKSTEIWSRRMRTLFTYRSHFGSRYHTRADAVTQAFFPVVRIPLAAQFHSQSPRARWGNALFIILTVGSLSLIHI